MTREKKAKAVVMAELNCSGEQRHYDMIQIKLVDRAAGTTFVVP
jgi:hypothetical protein